MVTITATREYFMAKISRSRNVVGTLRRAVRALRQAIRALFADGTRTVPATLKTVLGTRR